MSSRIKGQPKQTLLLDEIASPLEITPLRMDLQRHRQQQQMGGRTLMVAPEKNPIEIVVNKTTGDSSSDSRSSSGDTEREGWGSKVQFLLSVVAYAVGKKKGAFCLLLEHVEMRDWCLL